MHHDTRLAVIAAMAGLLVAAVYLLAGRPMAEDLHLAAGVILGVGAFLGLKHWHRRHAERTKRRHVREIREMVAEDAGPAAARAAGPAQFQDRRSNN